MAVVQVLPANAAEVVADPEAQAGGEVTISATERYAPQPPLSKDSLLRTVASRGLFRTISTAGSLGPVLH